MPLVYQQNINEATRMAVWHITEDEDFFLRNTNVPNLITHPHKRLQHLAGRLLLTELFEDFPLKLILVAETKKPFLANEAFHFSISHSGEYAAAIVSKRNRVGVDIEVSKEKIEKLKNKFLSEKEQAMLMQLATTADVQYPRSNTQMLTLAWSIKETLFKWYADSGIDFKEHLHIEKVSAAGNEYFADCIVSKNGTINLKVHGLSFNNNFLTWLLS